MAYITPLYLEPIGYVYAGMQHSDECFCGPSGNATRHGKVGDEQCNYTCTGNAEEMCGGIWRLSIWMQGIISQFFPLGSTKETYYNYGLPLVKICGKFDVLHAIFYMFMTWFIYLCHVIYIYAMIYIFLP